MNRIHGTFLQTSCSTGRLAITNPNLQSVVRDIEIDFHPSTNQQQTIKSEKISIRNAFVAREGNILLSSDFKQIELRLMAHFSQDPKLLAIFKWKDDPFKTISSQCFGKSTTMDRQQAKRLCYGVIYGMGISALSTELKCTKEMAKEYLQQFKENFPRMIEYFNEVVDKCRRDGYVQTILGRKRCISKMNSKQEKERKQAERQAINTICQGSGADIIKLSMIQIDAQLKRQGIPALFVHEMHDELIIEIPNKFVEQTKQIVEKTMENAITLTIPLLVEIKTGTTWGNMKK